MIAEITASRGDAKVGENPQEMEMQQAQLEIAKSKASQPTAPKA
jgi:hypothetical protein